ncbi:hypothetical protein HAX54_023035 [Datura stramonium]|uniref:UBC core domain-containing protein n=1 Tax=Datura stramonium TaxID=4076 RepID=A0ABS8UY12_DATST|nr:hypothetical protein [Datura stramonium]
MLAIHIAYIVWLDLFNNANTSSMVVVAGIVLAPASQGINLIPPDSENEKATTGPFILIRILAAVEKEERANSDDLQSKDEFVISWIPGCSLPLNDFMTVHEGRIYQLKLFCGKEYPDQPPGVRFQSRINMSCVNYETGVVEPSLFPMLADWKRESTMEDILMQLKKEMMSPQNRRLSQPSDGNEEGRVDQKGLVVKCCIM